MSIILVWDRFSIRRVDFKSNGAKQLEVVIQTSRPWITLVIESWGHQCVLASGLCSQTWHMIFSGFNVHFKAEYEGSEWRPAVDYLPSSKTNLTTQRTRRFPFNASPIESCSHILRSFLPFFFFSFRLLFNSSFILLAIWASRNESICIERTGGCESDTSMSESQH